MRVMFWTAFRRSAWHNHENACRQNTHQERRHRGRIQMRRGNRARICEMRKRTASGKNTSCWRLSFWRFSIGFRIITALFHIKMPRHLSRHFYYFLFCALHEKRRPVETGLQICSQLSLQDRADRSGFIIVGFRDAVKIKNSRKKHFFRKQESTNFAFFSAKLKNDT